MHGKQVAAGRQWQSWRSAAHRGRGARLSLEGDGKNEENLGCRRFSHVGDRRFILRYAT